MLALSVDSCGWHPLYATKAGETSAAAPLGLSQITVALIPERSGQLLRLALQERFERFDSGAARKYDLTVSFSIASESIAVRPDSTSTRTRLVGTAKWTLAALDGRHTSLTSGTARDVDGYDIIDQQYFAADLEGDAVRRRIADAIADQVTRQLAVYFNRPPSAG